MADNGNLIPGEVLNELAELDKKLKDCIKTSSDFLQTATTINKQLGNSVSSWKELNKTLVEYAQAESSVIAMQKEHQKILEQKQKLMLEVIQITSIQVKDAQNLTKSVQEQNKAQQEATKSQQEVTKAQQEATKETQNSIKENKNFSKVATELDKRLKDVRQGLNYTKLLKNVKSGNIEASEAIERVNEKMASSISVHTAYKKALEKGEISQKSYDKAMRELQPLYAKIIKASGSLTEANGEVSDSFKESIKETGSCYTTAEKARIKLKDSAGSLFDTLFEGTQKNNVSTQSLIEWWLKFYDSVKDRSVETSEIAKRLFGELNELMQEHYKTVEKTAVETNTTGDIFWREHEEDLERARQAEVKLYEAKLAQANITEILAKTLKEIQEEYESADPKMRQLIDTLTQQSLKQQEVKDTLAELQELQKQDGTPDYTREILALQDAETECAESVKKTKNEIELHGKAVEIFGDQYKKLISQYGSAKEKLDALSQTEGATKSEKEKLEKQLKKVEERMKGFQEATKEAQTTIGKSSVPTKDWDAVLGKLAPTITSAIKQTVAFNKSLLKLLANPVVAIVAAIAVTLEILVSVFKALINTAKGNEEQFAKLKQVMAPIEAITDAINRVMEDLVGILLDLAEKLVGVVTGFLKFFGLFDDLIDKTNEYIQVEKDRLELTKAIRAANEKSAESDAKLADLRDKLAKKENAPLEERLKLIEEIGDIEVERAEKQEELAEESLRLLKLEAERKENSAEMADKLSQAEIALTNATAARVAAQRKAEKDIEDAKKQEADKIKKKMEAEKKAAQELAAFELQLKINTAKELITADNKTHKEREEALADYINKQQEAIEQAAKNELANTELTASQRKLIEAKKNAELEKLNKERENMEQELVKKHVTEQTQALMKGLEEEQKVINKAEATKLKDLYEQHKKGKLSQAQYEEAKKKLTLESTQERYKAEVDMLEKMMKVSKLTEKEIADIKKQMNDASWNYTKSVNTAIREAKRSELVESETKQLKDLTLKYKLNVIERKKYEKEKTEISRKAGEERSKIEAEALREIMKSNDLDFDPLKDVEKLSAAVAAKVKEKRDKLAKDEADQLKDLDLKYQMSGKEREKYEDEKKSDC